MPNGEEKLLRLNIFVHIVLGTLYENALVEDVTGRIWDMYSCGVIEARCASAGRSLFRTPTVCRVVRGCAADLSDQR